MAPRNARQGNDEHEIQQDINAAIAGTEDEIFRDAMEDDLDDNDGDTELESMGEGLEGDQLDEDDINVEHTEGPDADEEDEDAEGDDVDGEEDEDEDEEQEEEEASGEDEQVNDQQRAQRGQDQRRPVVPSSRLREESERARVLERERDEARNQIGTLEARFNDLLQRVNSGQIGPPANQQPGQTNQQQAPQKPDMFTDPEGYEKWVLDRAEERAQASVRSALTERDQLQQQQVEMRVNQSFDQAARGERSFEFQSAYNKLTGLDPKDPQARALVQSIFNARDPQQALFEWWDENGGPEFRDSIARQLGFMPDETQQRGGQNRGERQPQRRQSQSQEARHVFRGPARRMPSLNGASGGAGSQRVSDPDMLDGSDSSVFEYATRR